jgi:hypothetical protein
MGFARKGGSEAKRDGVVQQAFADAISAQEPAAGITRLLLRDQLDRGRMNPTHMRAMAQLCYEFDCKSDEWLNKPTQVFLEWWRRHRDLRTNPSARRTNCALTLDPAVLEESYVCEALAGVSLFPYQSGAGQAWPVSGEIRCFPSLIGGYDIVIRRCWLQVDAGKLCEIETSEEKALRLDGTYGKVQVTWQGGKRQRPIYNVEGSAGSIGRVALPDDFCKARGLAHGDVIILRLAVYTADLERVAKDDDGMPERDAGRRRSDSVSLRRKDHTTMGFSISQTGRRVKKSATCSRRNGTTNSPKRCRYASISLRRCSSSSAAMPSKIAADAGYSPRSLAA